MKAPTAALLTASVAVILCATTASADTCTVPSAPHPTIQSAVDDQITVFFGVPKTRVEDPVNAIECVLELQRRVAELRRKGLRLEMAIGIHFGEVTVNRSAGHRVRYIARGNTTRLARRMSAAADHGEIIVSERVMAS